MNKSLKIAEKYQYIALMGQIPLFDQLTQQPTEETTGPPGHIYRPHSRPVPAREIIAPHFHADVEVVLFRDARCETIVDGAVHRVRGSGVQCVAPGAIHSYNIRGTSPRSRVWVLQVNLEYFRECIARHDPQLGDSFVRRIAGCPVDIPTGETRFESLMIGLTEENAAVSEISLAASLGGLYTFLGMLAGYSVADHATRPRAQAHALMNTVASFADRAVSLDTVARACALSRFHLCRTFKRQTGMTVGEYLTRMRILRAQQLLSGGRTVTRACFESGFNSVSYFITVFTRITGTTPKQWALRRTII